MVTLHARTDTIPSPILVTILGPTLRIIFPAIACGHLPQETAAFLIGPEAFSSDAGKVLDAIISETRGVLDRLKTVSLRRAKVFT